MNSENYTIVSSADHVSIAMEIIMIPLISIGNVIIITAVIHFKSIRKPGDFLVAQLASVDLVVGIIVLPFDLYVLIAGKYLGKPVPCYAMMFLWTLTLTCSVESLLCIAVENYYAVLRPLQHMKVFNANILKYMGVISWTIALALSIMATVMRKNWETEIRCTVSPNPMTIIISSLVVFLLLTSFVLYCRIFIAVARPTVFPQSRHNVSARSNPIKKSKTMVVVFFAFILFWSPLAVYLVYVGTSHNPFFKGFKFLILLGAMNSGVNWIVYVCKRNEFRKIAFKMCRQIKATTKTGKGYANHNIKADINTIC